MELIPSSKHRWKNSRNNANILEHNPLVISGFKIDIKNYNSFKILKQFFISLHFDIFIYKLENKEQVEVFLQSVSCKWLLFYLDTGNIEQITLNDKKFELLEKSTFFSSMHIGNSIKMNFGKGKYTFIICNLKDASENILLNYFSPLFNKGAEYPIIFNPIDYKTQVEWEKLLTPYEFPDLLSSHLISQLQVILSRFCILNKSRINKLINQSQPESKIFLVKNIIDCYPFKQHTLKSLSAEANLNIQIIKLKFQEIFQKTTHQYIIEKRMEYSRLLIETHLDYSVKQVSIICGFKKPQHFIRQFKKFYQLTPGQYINNLTK